jgi:hypothetical protein
MRAGGNEAIVSRQPDFSDRVALRDMVVPGSEILKAPDPDNELRLDAKWRDWRRSGLFSFTHGSRTFLAGIDGENQLLALFPALASTQTIEARHTSALPGGGLTGEGEFDKRPMNTGNSNLSNDGGPVRSPNCGTKPGS